MRNYTEKVLSQASTNAKNAEEIVSRLEKSEGTLETIALWMDLLGFRAHLDEENWDLRSEITHLGMKRIAALHEVGLLAMNKRYEVVQLNDAIVISQDVPEEAASKAVEDFLALVDYHFEVAALTDKMVGGCGVRGVVAKGFRYNLRGNLGWVSTKIDPKCPSFFCPRPVMMNTAFARAYGVESSQELKEESSLYIEKGIILDYRPSIMETWTLEKTAAISNFGDFFLVREEEV